MRLIVEESTVIVKEQTKMKNTVNKRGISNEKL